MYSFPNTGGEAVSSVTLSVKDPWQKRCRSQDSEFFPVNKYMFLDYSVKFRVQNRVHYMDGYD